MPRPMKYRVVAKALRKHGYTSRPGKGDHEVWTCSCGRKHVAVITKPGEISPGVIGDTIKKMQCLP
ncbi:MAG: type II toxin-antitoxin system HicA family toxin, partial [Phycicoccus sp.]